MFQGSQKRERGDNEERMAVGVGESLDLRAGLGTYKLRSGSSAELQLWA